MLTKDQRELLREEAVESAAGAAAELHAMYPEYSYSSVESWFRKFQQVPKTFTGERYVNRFKLGADPEFVFAMRKSLDQYDNLQGFVRMDAAAYRLHQGPAFGADNNGRLMEIRPWPSRSALGVCASILTTLRWLAILQPNCMDCEWQSGAFLYDDGIGGHVHFGRKRPTRKEEVVALDSLQEGLLNLGAYPLNQVMARRKGDARRQIYGKPGDFRLQQHGYEYRTFPSWLDSPELAFVTLTLAKLAVHDPGLYSYRGMESHRELIRLKNFLSFYKCRDDDARLALVLLSRGLPMHKGGDFKARWGIKPSIISRPKISVIPLAIRPDKGAQKELFELFFVQKPLEFRVPEVTWNPTNAPNGFHLCINKSTTILQKGLGEMIWDLCFHEAMPLVIQGMGRTGGYPIYISTALANCLPADWSQRLKGMANKSSDLGGYSIGIPQEFREGAFARRVKKALLSGVLPIWSVKDCKPSAFMEWKAKSRVDEIKKSKPRKFVGKLVWGSQPLKIGSITG